MDIFEEVLQHHFQNFKSVVYNNMFFVLCFVFYSGGGIECILVKMHSFPNGEHCGGPGFYPFEIHVFSILDNV